MFYMAHLNSPERPRRVGVEVKLYSFFNLGARWGGLSSPRPTALLSGNRHGTHFADLTVKLACQTLRNAVSFPIE